MDVREIRGDEIETIAGWLSRDENAKWLDFGRGRRRLDATTLAFMLQRDLHRIRVFTPDGGDRPIGVVALSDLDPTFQTASLWFVLGVKEHGRNGYTTRAASRLLARAFDELDLGAVSAWTLENNQGGQGVLEGLGFRRFGRQRCCHYIDGVALDRIWYDLLPDELKRNPGG